MLLDFDKTLVNLDSIVKVYIQAKEGSFRTITYSLIVELTDGSETVLCSSLNDYNIQKAFDNLKEALNQCNVIKKVDLWTKD